MEDSVIVSRHRVWNLSAPDQGEAAINEARAVVRAGGLVVLPTDTVYGVGADPFSPTAVARLLAAKGRGRSQPPPVLVADLADLAGVVHLTDGAAALADRFWPGPLTLVLDAIVDWDLGDLGRTVAVRVPDHDLVRALLRVAGPLAVSSANRTGEPPATLVDEAVGQLGDLVELYLDGGAAAGAPSTVVDGRTLRVLREGALPVPLLREVVDAA